MASKEIKFYFTPTAHGNRLYITDTKEPGKILINIELYNFLNSVSCWDGPDKKGEHYTSWEMPIEMTTAVPYIMKRYHYIEETDPANVEWLRS